MDSARFSVFKKYVNRCYKRRKEIINSLRDPLLFHPDVQILRPQSTIMRREYKAFWKELDAPVSYKKCQNAIKHMKKIRSCLKLVHKQVLKAFIVEMCQTYSMGNPRYYLSKKYKTIIGFIEQADLDWDTLQGIDDRELYYKAIGKIVAMESLILDLINSYPKLKKDFEKLAEQYLIEKNVQIIDAQASA